MSTARDRTGLDNLRSRAASNPPPRMEGISMFNRTARATSWAVPLLLAALLAVTGITAAAASVMGVWS